MNTNANAREILSPKYLRALNVQNALGYSGSWQEYERALGNGPQRQIRSEDTQGYIGHQVLLAVLGELA